MALVDPIRRWVGFVRLTHGRPAPRVLRHDVDGWRARQRLAVPPEFNQAAPVRASEDLA